MQACAPCLEVTRTGLNLLSYAVKLGSKYFFNFLSKSKNQEVANFDFFFLHRLAYIYKIRVPPVTTLSMSETQKGGLTNKNLSVVFQPCL